MAKVNVCVQIPIIPIRVWTIFLHQGTMGQVLGQRLTILTPWEEEEAGAPGHAWYIAKW